MTVRLTPRAEPNRTDLYDGVDRVVSDGTHLLLSSARWSIWMPLRSVAEIALDEDPGGDIG